jgi:hypothetical protein
MTGMITVSGCPRSGTSLMMNILREALGEDRILGSQFPREDIIRKKLDSSDIRSMWRGYLDAVNDIDNNEIIERAKDMNPDGFWEHTGFAVSGIHWKPGMEDLLARIDSADKPLVGKVVSQGLARSDPKYIHKIIYMLRDPGSVAKSQERLTREFKFIHVATKKKMDLFSGLTINSPKMFIQVTLSAVSWLLSHPNIEVCFVKYDDLIANPLETLVKVHEFLGEGDFASAANVVNPSLKRSYPKWSDILKEDAEFIYEKLLEQDWNSLLEFTKDPKREINRQTTFWECARSGLSVNEKFCNSCIESAGGYRMSVKQHAYANEIDWKKLPCAYECFFNLDNPTFFDKFKIDGFSEEDAFDKAIDKSIRNNFWFE